MATRKTDLATAATSATVQVLPPAPDPDTTSSLTTRGRDLLALARSITVTDPASFALAATIRSEQIRLALQQLDRLLDKNIKLWHQGHKAAVAQKKEIAGPIEQADAIIKAAQEAYQTRELARQKEERRRLAAAVEAERIRMLEAEREAETARLAIELEAAASAGDMGRVEEILEQLGSDGTSPDAVPQPTALIIPTISRPLRTEGATTRMLPRFRIVDPGKIKHSFLFALLADVLTALQGDIGEIRDHIPADAISPVTAAGRAFLLRAIKVTVEQHRDGAEAIVGEGAIEFYEQPSVGTRQATDTYI
jgi:hypothetical protein